MARRLLIGERRFIEFDSCLRLMGLRLRLFWLLIFWRHAFAKDRGRVSARQPSYFLLPESSQRAGPYGPRPFASLRADLRRQVLGAVRQNSLRVFDAPFKHVAASQMTMQLHSAVQLRAPSTCRRRRGPTGRYRMRTAR